MEIKRKMALWEGKIPKWVAWIIILFALFIMIYFCYNLYKAITAKCRVCGKKVEGQWGRKIGFIYTPWRKIKFLCLDCQKKR